jgi:hypothetical protein
MRTFKDARDDMLGMRKGALHVALILLKLCDHVTSTCDHAAVIRRGYVKVDDRLFWQVLDLDCAKGRFQSHWCLCRDKYHGIRGTSHAVASE